MDSRWREILRKHRYVKSANYPNSFGSCSCKTLFPPVSDPYELWLDHIEALESQQPNTLGVGLPPQRSMTPEESANLAAYHKTKFKPVAAQDDGLRELLEEAKERMLRQGWAVSVSAGTREFYEKVCAALASEKAAPEELTQTSEELGTCDREQAPHAKDSELHYTVWYCRNWRPLPKAGR